MKPPICRICGKRFDIGEGDLVYFEKRDSDIAWIKRMEETGAVGHPPYADWFCENHIKRARLLKHLTIDKAMEQMRE